MIRLIGAFLIVSGCGVFSFCISDAHRKEVKLLRGLRNILQEMQWELKYRLTELPELCDIAASAAAGSLRDFFHTLAGKLRRREVEDISGCINAMLAEKEFPRCVRKNIRQLGMSLGRFDLEGQLQGLEAVRQQCCCDLRKLEENGAKHLRSYQTLAVWGGAALAILLI